MTATADGAGRLRALTDHASTLIVEAGAGTGKTSLLAGRLVLLMAAGVPPRSIAAITFTESAAAELAARVRGFAAELLAGRMPPGLGPALHQGLLPQQRLHLSAAYDRLDELGSSTIHGFCQDIVRAHAIEACVDPGAEIIDADAADQLLRTVFDEWFRERMSAAADPAAPAAVLARGDPSKVVETLWKLTRFRLRHRSARPERIDWTDRPDVALRSAMDEFRLWTSRAEQEPLTLGIVGQLEELASFYDGCLDGIPSFDRLWALGHPPRIACMRWDSLELLPLRTGPAWRRLLGPVLGAARFEEAERHFKAVDLALRTMLGHVATALVETLSAEMDDLLERYAGRKRSAAVLDFDDLLEQACRMVRDHEPVRRALGGRYLHIAVDEFQDTDRVQCEMLFRLAAIAPAARWQDCVLRPGALFLVGDPKQSIYRFRGAAAETYVEAKALVLRSHPDALVTVIANFRSRPGILDHVNRCFRGPLARHGYADLSPTLDDDPLGPPGVVRLRVVAPPGSKVSHVRETESEAVAKACVSLLGGYQVRSRDGATRPLRPGDIALLTPTTSEIWLYERALQRRGLAVASQAGRGFYRRQEVQDLMALALALSDPADTLAFGAFMRGPLVGLTDGALLDVTAALPTYEHREPVFSIRTPLEHVADPIARHALTTLKALRRRVSSATPHQVMSEAVEMFEVRVKLVRREPTRSAGALANVDAFLDLARPYAVRGLAGFARDVSGSWRRQEPRREGLPDLEHDAIALMTMHGAKGLEWPVVIPINCASHFRRRDPFVHRESDDTIHWLVGDVVPPGLAVADAEERAGIAREREQLWYVACTRARNLLVVPQFGDVGANSWARVLDLAPAGLPELDIRGDPVWKPSSDRPGRNEQSAAAFAIQQEMIEAVSRPLAWITPSDIELDRADEFDLGTGDDRSVPQVDAVIGAGRVRGLVLHKLLEEMITGELAPELPLLLSRARALLPRLTSSSPDSTIAPDPAEMATTALEVTSIPDIEEMWPDLASEAAVYGTVAVGSDARPLSGRADAVQVRDGRVVAVVDWKSDVAPGREQMREHMEQLRLYLAATGAPRGVLVYLTTKEARWTTAERRLP